MPDLLPGTTVLGADTPKTEESDSGTSITSITDTDWVEGSPVVGHTFTAPTTGRVKVTVGGNIISEGTHRLFLSYEIYEGEDETGTEVHSASRIFGIAVGDSDTFVTMSRTRLIEGLTPEAEHFIRTMHQVSNAAANASIQQRSIMVEPST